MITTAENWVITSLPFIVSLIVQWLNFGVRGYAERAKKMLWPQSAADEATDLESRAVDLAVHTYLHLSFVLALVVSSVSCIAYTAVSNHPVYAAGGAVALVVLLPIWLFKWQGMSATDLEGRTGATMKVVSLASILVLWGVTLAARV